MASKPIGDRYHIKDDGTPGKCSASSPESCPKTKAGDGFHGSLPSALAESERRFEEEHGSIPALSTSDEKKGWNSVGRRLYKDRIHGLATGVSVEDLEAKTAQGLAENHGVPIENVTIDGGDRAKSNDTSYFVKDQNGVERAYGDKIVGKEWTLKYLGVRSPGAGENLGSSSSPVEDRRAFSTDMMDSSEYRVEGGSLKAELEGESYDLGELKEVSPEEVKSWSIETFGSELELQDGEVFPLYDKEGSEAGAYMRSGAGFYRAGEKGTYETDSPRPSSELSPAERAQDLKDSVRDYRDSKTSETEREGIREYWKSQNIPNQFAAMNRAAELKG